MNDKDKSKEALIAELAEARRQVAERKKIEAELAHERNLLRTLIDNLPNSHIFVKDRDSRFITTNTAHLKTLGVTSPEVIGKTDFDFFPEALAQKYYEDEQTVIQTGQPLVDIREPVIDYRGNRKWYLTTKVPLRNQQKEITGLVGISQDITNHKHAEDLLMAQQQILELIAKGSPLDEILHRTTQVVEDRSKEMFCSILLLDETGTVLHHGAAPSLPEAYQQAVDGISIGPNQGSCGTAAHRKETVIVSDIATDPLWEKYRELAMSYSLKACWSAPIFSTVGDVLGTFAIYYKEPRQPTTYDIDLIETAAHLLGIAIERQQAETALQQSKQEFQTLLNSITDYVWSANVHNGEVTYRYYSPVVERITGYPADHFMKGVEHWLDLIHPEDRPTARAKMENEMAGELVEHEYRIIRSDGEIRWLYGTTSPTVDETGRVIRLDGVVSDITERKKLEEQLSQAQKMEAIGTLAGGIAHDFNNMLTAIMGYADLSLAILAPDNAVYQDIEGIRKISQRAATLTGQLLAFARRQIIEPQPIDLNDLISNMSKMLRRLIGEDIELVTRPDPNLGQIKADPHQLEQILVNLVVNARDAMSGGGRLIIETANVTADPSHTELPAGEYVLLAVSDNGQGMSEEVRSHIFEPFFTTKEVGQGTGLGLATCFGIVKQNKGHIDVYSEVDQGTTVNVYLPRIAKNEAETEAAGATHSPAKLPAGRETIMLVEDEPSVRYLSGRMLRHYGYTVLEAANGSDALQLIEQQPPPDIDLLITDMIMPKIGGKLLANRLREQQPNAKILYISGYTSQKLAGSLEPGTTFLQKPFSPDLLVRKVREVLDTPLPS